MTEIDLKNMQAHAYIVAIGNKLNVDCFFLTEGLSAQYQEVFELLQSVKLNYDSEVDYKKIYTKLQKMCAILETQSADGTKEKTFHNNLFIALYEPGIDLTEVINNAFLEFCDNNKKVAFKSLNQNQRWAKFITQTNDPLFNKNGKKQTLFWGHPESIFERVFNGVFGLNYHAQNESNMPYELKVENISYEQPQNSEESKLSKPLRIGTQIEQDYGTPRIYANFEKYIAAKAKPGEISHVYINKQKNNDDDLESRMERKRTQRLHEMEKPGSGIVVITTPADNSFFFKGVSKGNMSTSDPNVAKDNLNDIINTIHDSIINNKNDFEFSEAAINEVFGGEELVHAAVTEMLERSSKKFGVENNFEKIDHLTRQAILMDFINVNLNDRILSKYQPDTYNISCKDAIDRAGIANLAYLMYKSNYEMDENTFNRLLDVPAVLVKSRPLNDHFNVMYNYVNKLNDNEFFNEKGMGKWINAWLGKNNPYANTVQQQIQNQDVAQEQSTSFIGRIFGKIKSFINMIKSIFSNNNDTPVTVRPEELKKDSPVDAGEQYSPTHDRNKHTKDYRRGVTETGENFTVPERGSLSELSRSLSSTDISSPDNSSTQKHTKNSNSPTP